MQGACLEPLGNSPLHLEIDETKRPGDVHSRGSGPGASRLFVADYSLHTEVADVARHQQYGPSETLSLKISVIGKGGHLYIAPQTRQTHPKHMHSHSPTLVRKVVHLLTPVNCALSVCPCLGFLVSVRT
jgi:hypothetical protein